METKIIIARKFSEQVAFSISSVKRCVFRVFEQGGWVKMAGGARVGLEGQGMVWVCW